LQNPNTCNIKEGHLVGILALESTCLGAQGHKGKQNIRIPISCQFHGGTKILKTSYCSVLSNFNKNIKCVFLGSIAALFMKVKTARVHTGVGKCRERKV
jgi:hypothetical protein